mmetsp:Transcript_71631/g.99173  ORF Transcript_71631/g.99173 Transcript_71631/m.99173 type:complete len:92 (-) Transcript_71631:79-354(-)
MHTPLGGKVFQQSEVSLSGPSMRGSQLPTDAVIVVLVNVVVEVTVTVVVVSVVVVIVAVEVEDVVDVVVVAVTVVDVGSWQDPGPDTMPGL